MALSYRYRLPYRWTIGVVTTVYGRQLVANHILMAVYGRHMGYNTQRCLACLIIDMCFAPVAEVFQ